MPGEAVRRLVEGRDSQRGYVLNTSCQCHVQIFGRNFIICDLLTKDLEPMVRISVIKFKLQSVLESCTGMGTAVVPRFSRGSGVHKFKNTAVTTVVGTTSAVALWD